MRSGPKKALRSSAAVSLASVLLLAGCGSSAQKVGTVTPVAYVSAVCSTVASWYQSLSNSGNSLERTVTSKTPPEQAKKEIENYLSVALADTESTVRSLRAAGIPKVVNGQHLASLVVKAFERAGARLRSAQNRFAPAKITTVSALRSQAKQVAAEVNSLPLVLSGTFGGANSPELDKASEQSTVCRGVGARPAKR